MKFTTKKGITKYKSLIKKIGVDIRGRNIERDEDDTEEDEEDGDDDQKSEKGEVEGEGEGGQGDKEKPCPADESAKKGPKKESMWDRAARLGVYSDTEPTPSKTSVSSTSQSSEEEPLMNKKYKKD